MTLEAAVTTQSRRARIANVLLLVSAVVQLVGVALYFSQRDLLLRVQAGEAVSEAEATANDATISSLAMGEIGALILTAIAFLMWFHRAHANVRMVGTGNASRSARDATIGWFIPILNLFRPYADTTEIWQRSETGNTTADLKGLKTPAVVALWWLFFVGTAMLSRYISSASRGVTTVEPLIAVTNLAILEAALRVVAALLAMRVVSGIDRMQQAFTSKDRQLQTTTA